MEQALIKLGILIVATGSCGLIANAAQARGTLKLSEGIAAVFNLSSANCVAGPGDTLSISAGKGGGWDALSLTAFDPSVGRRGTAYVDLDESGFTRAPYAVADWAWTAKKNSGHISRPLNINSNGQGGAFSVVLGVSNYFQGAPTTRPVKIAASWSSGTCKT
jgi:hypothetical protein